MANYLPVALSDSARSWLTGLPRQSVGSWKDLRDLFISNFQGTYERPGDQYDLLRLQQGPNETLKEYIKRFSEARNKIPDVNEEMVIASFRKGVTDPHFVAKFTRKPPHSVGQLFDMANKYAASAKAVKAVGNDKARAASKEKKKDDKPAKDSKDAARS